MNRPEPVVFDLEVFPEGGRFSDSPTWIAGVLHRPGTQMITDVRARIGPRLILGLVHLRPSSVAAVEPDSDVRFSFLLQPHRGANRLTLDWRDASGRWTEFFAAAITPGASAPSTPAFPAIRWRETLTAALRLRLHNPSWSWAETAAQALFPSLAERLNSDPNPPLWGALEEPVDFGRIQDGSLSVTGWLACPGRAIARVHATLDPYAAIDLSRTELRRDVPLAFPSISADAIYPFAGKIDYPAALGAPALLKVYAEFADGETVLAFGRRFVPKFHGATDRLPPGVTTMDIFRAAWSLKTEAANHGSDPAGWLGAAFAARRQLRSEARYRGNVPRPAAAAHPAAAPDLLPADLPREISPGDDMWGTDEGYYFRVGYEAAELIKRVADEFGLGPSPAILDLPCGHGRVGRWLRAYFPEGKLTACDLQADGAEFCRRLLGARGVQAQVDGSHWALLDEKFDLIWCGSLLTHFASPQWKDLVDRFSQCLKPGGALIVTTHGLVALDLLCTGEKDYGLDGRAVEQLRRDALATGFGFASYRGQPGYGISMSHPGWVAAKLSEGTGLRVRRYLAAGWGGHQDVFVCRRLG